MVDEMGDDRASTPLDLEQVVLPLDGSAFALAALPTARALCERFTARLLTLSVVADAREAEELRQHVTEALGDDAGAAGIEVVVAADPAGVIAGRVAELGSAIVCMSTRGRGRVSGSVIGSVARAVFRLSSRPLVVVGPQADRPESMVDRPRRRPPSWPEPLSVGSLVVCVDGSARSEALLPTAAAWAAALDMDLSVLTVAQDAASSPGGGRPNAYGPPNPKEYVQGVAEKWREAVPGSVGEVVYDPIGVASGIQSFVASHHVGMVALTTHARTGLGRLRLGATAADIVRTSTVPALVVPLADP